MLLAGTLWAVVASPPTLPPASLTEAEPDPVEADAKHIGHVPEHGVGFVTSGTVLTAAGLWGVFVGVGVMAEEPNYASGPVLLSGGVAVLGAGVPMMVIGAKRNWRYRRWAKFHHLRPPPTGMFLVHGGAYVTGIGAALTGLGAYLSGTEGVDGFGVLNLVVVGFGLGILGGGATMLALGVRQHREYEAWSTGPRFSLHPFVAPVSPRQGRGAVVGLSGQF